MSRVYCTLSLCTASNNIEMTLFHSRIGVCKIKSCIPLTRSINIVGRKHKSSECIANGPTCFMLIGLRRRVRSSYVLIREIDSSISLLFKATTLDTPMKQNENKGAMRRYEVQQTETPEKFFCDLCCSNYFVWG